MKYSAKISEDDFVLWTYTPLLNAESGKTSHQVPRRTSGTEGQSHLESFKPAIAREIKLKAIFETPSVSFSKRSILFRIDAAPVQEGFERRGIFRLNHE